MANSKLSNDELKRFLFHLINTLIAKNCYIKSYFKNYRVMDEKHNPEINITPEQFNILLKNKIIEQRGEVWATIVEKNPFPNFSNVRLTFKTYV